MKPTAANGIWRHRARTSASNKSVKPESVPAQPGNQSHPAIGQLNPGRAHFEIAFVLKEVEMPVALCLRIVNRMRLFGACVRKGCSF